MHTHALSEWVHEHVFDVSSEAAERSTRVVMWITLVTMVIEITAGWWYNSMALMADGWHMSSHAVAIGLSAMAYATARRFARDPRFAFGTWKVEVLGGFASAIFLLGVAAMMVVGSVERIASPQPVQYLEAMVVGVLGLVVNLVCALILGKAHHHGHDHGRQHAHAREAHHDHAHGHDHDHDHDHDHAAHGDLNLKSAYLHVLADAATSVLAIVALAGGWFFGWSLLDPLMGVVGAVLVAVWAKGLVVETATVLLDREMDHPVVDQVRRSLEGPRDASETRVTDLHVWRVGKQVFSCAATVVSHDPSLTAAVLRRRLAAHPEIVHSTIEVHQCAAETTLSPQPAGPGPA